jgi:hypothetical protein
VDGVIYKGKEVFTIGQICEMLGKDKATLKTYVKDRRGSLVESEDYFKLSREDVLDIKEQLKGTDTYHYYNTNPDNVRVYTREYVQELAKLFTDTAATQKQLDYIKAIQDDIGGNFTGTTKREASEWLSRMVPIYKQWVRDRQLEAEIDAEIQDGRRDW